MRSLLKIPTTLFLLLPLLLPAQNLVPNPGFEEYTECPDGLYQIVKALGWKTFGTENATPDYFHECSDDSIQDSSGWYILAGVPNNLWGHQYALDGKAYAGFAAFDQNYWDGSAFREVIGTELLEPLHVDTAYYVSFWVSPGFGSLANATIFTNKLGVRFSMVEHNRLNDPVNINNYAHVYTNRIISDTSEWTLVTGQFVAANPYRYLMLSNFFDNDHTDTITGHYFNGLLRAYYYIDNICVSSDSSDCAPWDTIIPKEPETNCYSGFTLYPNPTISEFTITFDCDQEKVVRIYDVIGRLVIHKTLISEIMEYDVRVDHWASGMYLVEVKYGQKTLTKKVVIQ